ncbi:MAG: hypothetical protein K2K93_01690, partial [Muribaculaceae bacterium]|nr:hypothetical protein [Muribaculaceae bacterium]
MKKVLLLLIMALQSMLMSADTWNYIGQGTWEDPFWTNGGSPLVQTVDVEESKQTAGVYRVKFLWDNTYTTIHCEKPNKVYVKSYTHAISEGNTRTVEQICVENGWTESYYGTFNGECATIPGDAFMYRKGSASQWYKCDSKRKCVFTLPRLEEGVYMGIISFKNNIDYKPISILTSATKDNFTSFVDQMTMG